MVSVILLYAALRGCGYSDQEARRIVRAHAALPLASELWGGTPLISVLGENTMAGGDNCHRGAVLGALLSIAGGSRIFPESWSTGLIDEPVDR
ncbi:MAG TPA: ADP-ribosylglycohydrolase family protein [Alkalispirochaeta sp.]|nr:ADP-ribosylglycohydrolase family protein [Alkalispirochaeta sp.]